MKNRFARFVEWLMFLFVGFLGGYAFTGYLDRDTPRLFIFGVAFIVGMLFLNFSQRGK